MLLTSSRKTCSISETITTFIYYFTDFQKLPKGRWCLTNPLSPVKCLWQEPSRSQRTKGRDIAFNKLVKYLTNQSLCISGVYFKWYFLYTFPVFHIFYSTHQVSLLESNFQLYITIIWRCFFKDIVAWVPLQINQNPWG